MIHEIKKILEQRSDEENTIQKECNITDPDLYDVPDLQKYNK